MLTYSSVVVTELSNVSFSSSELPRNVVSYTTPPTLGVSQIRSIHLSYTLHMLYNQRIFASPRYVVFYLSYLYD